MTKAQLQLVTSLTILLLLVVSVPSAMAHTATEPIKVETQVLTDEAEDAFYWYDGYDLYKLYVREAHDRVTDQNGLIFRYDLYGGFTETPVASQLHIDFTIGTPAGNETFRMTTEDDQNWTGDLDMVALNVTQDEAPYTGVTALVQAFLPYSALNASIGDTIGPITMRSLADEDVRDIAPGGVFLPGSGGQAEAPHPAGESQRLVGQLQLNGPTGYLDWQGELSNQTVTITADNALSSTGQHVYLEPLETDGWTVQAVTEQAGSIGPDESITFQAQLDASPNATEPLPIRIATDLGGADMFYMGVNGTTLQTGPTPESVDIAPQQAQTNESPSPSPLLVVTAVSLTLIAARRHR